MHPGARLGSRRRLPAVELRLPQLPRRARAAPSGAPAHPGVGRRQRRRRGLVPVNGSPESASRSRASRAVAARPAPLAHRRHPADQRRSRSLPGAAVPARVAAAGRVRDRGASAAVSPRETCSTGRSSAFPSSCAGETLELGREEQLADLDGGRDRPRRRGAWPCRASGRCIWRAGARRPEDNVGLRIRDRPTGASLAYLSRPWRRSPPDVRRALAGADCVFFDGTFWSSDELLAPGSAPSAPRTWPTGRSAAPTAASPSWPSCGAAPRSHPHEQHQPAAARGLARARGVDGGRLGGRPRRHGAGAVSGRRARAAQPATSSSTGSGARARAATTTTTPFTAACTRASSRGCSCSRGC